MVTFFVTGRIVAKDKTIC